MYILFEYREYEVYILFARQFGNDHGVTVQFLALLLLKSVLKPFGGGRVTTSERATKQTLQEQFGIVGMCVHSWFSVYLNRCRN